jgi:predicted DNA-binding transcriptional regulator YafY
LPTPAFDLERADLRTFRLDRGHDRQATGVRTVARELPAAGVLSSRSDQSPAQAHQYKE